MKIVICATILFEFSAVNNLDEGFEARVCTLTFSRSFENNEILHTPLIKMLNKQGGLYSVYWGIGRVKSPLK